MGSFLGALAVGYCSIALFRLLPKGGLDRKSVGLLVVLVSLLIALVVKLEYSSTITIVLASLGMQAGALWLPAKRPVPSVDLVYIFVGSSLAMGQFLLIPVTAVLLFNKLLGKNFLLILGAVIAVSSLGAYFLQKPDAITLYLLELYVAISLKSRLGPPVFGARLKITTAISMLTLIFLMLFLNRYVYHGFGMQRDIFRAGPQSVPVVALTFDDGPSSLYTSAILDILKEKSVPATFFLVGKHVEKYPEVAKRVILEGHVAGNHTYSHANLLGASQHKALREIIKNQEIITEVTEETPKYFRPPRGLYDRAVLDTVVDNNLTMILWSVSSQDWAGEGWKDIVNNVTKNVKPGSVILFHDSGDLITAQGENRANTVKALPVIIDDLKEKGYAFVTIPKMLMLSGLMGEEGFEGGFLEENLDE